MMKKVMAVSTLFALAFVMYGCLIGPSGEVYGCLLGGPPEGGGLLGIKAGTAVGCAVETHEDGSFIYKKDLKFSAKIDCKAEALPHGWLYTVGWPDCICDTITHACEADAVLHGRQICEFSFEDFDGNGKFSPASFSNQNGNHCTLRATFAEGSVSWRFAPQGMDCEVFCCEAVCENGACDLHLEESYCSCSCSAMLQSCHCRGDIYPDELLQ